MQKQKRHTDSVDKNAYVYVRVSSEEQVTNYSLANQEEYCRKGAANNGYEVTGVYREEGVSAKTLNRPKLLSLLEDCRKNKGRVSAVFIYKIDRISRETYDFLAFKRKLASYGIRIISVTEPTEDNPVGEFLETLLAASAKLDNATKGLRSADGMRKRLEDGWANGKSPAGYLNVTKGEKQIIEKDPEQFDLVKKAWIEMASGAYSLETIAEYMNKLGIVIKIGSRRMEVRTQQAQRLFRDKFYAGYVVSKKFGIDKIGKHAPMICEDMFYRVQAIVDGRSFTKGIKYTKLNENFPLRGHVLCGVCGSKMTASFSKGRKNRYPYYFCLNCRPGKSISKKRFEELFLDFLDQIKPKKELVDLFCEMVKEKWKNRYSYLANQAKSLKSDLMVLYEVRKRLAKKNLDGVFSDEIFQEQLALVEDEILVKKSSVSEVRLQKVDIDVVVNFMEAFLNSFDVAWAEGKLNQRKLLTGSIFPESLLFEKNGFRTTKLGPCFEAISLMENAPESSWVGDRI